MPTVNAMLLQQKTVNLYYDVTMPTYFYLSIERYKCMFRYLYIFIQIIGVGPPINVAWQKTKWLMLLKALTMMYMSMLLLLLLLLLSGDSLYDYC